MKRIARTLLLLPLVACATTKLKPEAASVRITANPETVRGCKFLQNVSGSDHWNGGLAQGTAEESAIAEMKNATQWIGGNVILMVSSNTGWGGSSQRGEAYACPARPTESASK